MIKTSKRIYSNLSFPQLVEHALHNGEGVLGTRGELICGSGEFTGRSPKDKFFVEEPASRDHLDWGAVNQTLDQQHFDSLYQNVHQHMGDKNLYVVDGYCGADPTYRLKIRFITEKAWHAHFVRNMFIRPEDTQATDGEPDFTIINACSYAETNYAQLGLRSKTFIAFHLAKKMALIGGTEYAGEMKKGIFSVMNYLLPFKQVLPMHCSANIGEKGDVALFFGLSGTGKTTLSTAPNRRLIGDDEHGWSEQGIFNFEGGCYAKTINLSQQREPEIWNSIRFGAILENVVYNPETRAVDFNDSAITENTRVSYPIDFIENFEPSGCGGHPSCIIFLTCDAFGILPPVAHLTPEQAYYHFLSGYTAKVAGTERGVLEPQATFSTCFGGPFMTREPKVYGDLLAQKMRKHSVPAYLVNTGWTGGKYGVGKRIDLAQTRLIIDAILDGRINQAKFARDEVFGFDYAINLAGVDSTILEPATAYGDADAYKAQKRKMAEMFAENFAAYCSKDEMKAGGILVGQP